MNKNNTGFLHEAPVSETRQWYTPPSIFKALKIEFDLDPCSPGQTIVPWIPVKKHYKTVEDGLLSPWFGNCWVNPPYGKDVWKWLKLLSLHGNGIALVFSRTDSKWFQEYAPLADAVCFIRDRIRFISGKKVNPGCKHEHGTAGSGSALLAWGIDNVYSLIRSKLGWTVLKTEYHL